MAQLNTFSIKFYIQKSKLNSHGTAPIIARITVDGERTSVSIKRQVEPDRWDTSIGKAKGRDAKANCINADIDSIKARFHEIKRDIILRNKKVTAGGIKNVYLGKDNESNTLSQAFAQNRTDLESRIGIDCSETTLVKYNTIQKHITAFLKSQYSMKDIALNELKYSFITNFERFMITSRKCAHNTTLKYIQGFKKIIKLAVDNDWLHKDPFLKYKVRLKKVNRIFLNEKELWTLETKHFEVQRLREVRDIYVFCCYTGFAYIDVSNLSADCVQEEGGGEWIKIKRQKSKVQASVMLLPQARRLIEQYREHPICVKNNKLLPIISNQNTNAYLKEIADLCGIDKKLCFHSARHTFATTVTLNNGVPLETVSKMLGHTNLRTTQIYAKILDRKVGEDMTMLEERLNQKKVSVNYLSRV